MLKIISPRLANALSQAVENVLETYLRDFILFVKPTFVLKIIPIKYYLLEKMIIDEEKIRRRSSIKGAKWMMPSLRFERKKSQISRTAETFRLVIGIAVAAAMFFATCALIYTLATESSSAASAIVQKASQQEKPRFIPVTFKPKENR